MSSSSLFPFYEWFESIFLFWSIYLSILADHGSPSWKLKCIVAEVGCRGYIPPSFRKALQLFGFTSKELKALVDECSLVSRRSSYYIWLNRFHQSLIPFQMVQVDIDAYQYWFVKISTVLRVLCNAIVRKVQQRNRDSQKDTAPGIHFVKEKATSSTAVQLKHTTKKTLSMEILLPQMIGQFSSNFQNSRHSQ